MHLSQPFVYGLILVGATGIQACDTETQPDAEGAPDLPGRIVDVAAGEFFFQAPESLPPGLTTFQLRQIGRVSSPAAMSIAQRDSLLRAEDDPTHGFHMLWIVRLSGDKTAADLLQAAEGGEPTPWATPLGGPGFVYPPRTTNATMQLAPGNYALVCYVGSTREDQRRHHLLRGMIRPLTVMSSAAPPTPTPEPDVVVRILGNDSLEFSRPLAAPGTWLIQVENHSQSETDFHLARLLPGHSVQAALAWRRRDGTPSPHEPWAGLASVPPGSTLQTTVDLIPGTYLIGRTPVVIPASGTRASAP